MNVNVRPFVMVIKTRMYAPSAFIRIILTSFSHRNVAEQLIEKGLASAVRHRRDDEDRSPDYDKLMAAEQA